MLMAGLGVGVGHFRHQNQQMQRATDAIAGAATFSYGGKCKVAVRVAVLAE
jgi:hypothetical protein